jgi:hypothetical protein
MADIRIIPSTGLVNVTGSINFRGTGGSTMLFMTGSSGNVGIGTTSSTYKLSVHENVNSGLLVTFRNPNTGTGQYTEFKLGQADASEVRIGSAYNYASAEWNQSWIYAVNRNLALKTPSGYHIRFYAGGTTDEYERMRVDSGGNIGIGTTSPAGKLSISTPTAYDGTILQLQSRDEPTAYNLKINEVVTSGVVRWSFDMTNSSAYNNTLVFDRGNIGIGVTTPSQKLEVTGNIYATGYVQGSTAYMSDQSGVSSFGSNSSTRSIRVGRDGTANDIFITGSSGNVGIGSATPAYKLDIVGTSRAAGMTLTGFATGTSGGNLELGFDGVHGVVQAYNRTSGWIPLYLSGVDVRFNPQGTETMRIASDGNVGIGTTNPSYKLDVEGSVNGEFRAASFVNANTGTGAYGEINVVGNDATLRIGITNTNYGGQWTGGGVYFLSPGGMFFGPGGDYKLSVLANGNVGIGSTAPTNKLQVVGGVTATSFTGSLSGNAATATTATNAGSIDITQVNDDSSYQVTFTTTNTSGYSPLYIDEDDSHLTYNPSTRTLTSATFVGALTGNASTATTASFASTAPYSGLTGTVPTWNQNTTGTADYATYLFRRDIRAIAPNDETSGTMRFGFTSWGNNNTSPYADFLHLRSYTDSSGGSDNLVMFLKSGIGMRIYQQSWNSGTDYSSYKDVAFTDSNITGNAATATTASFASTAPYSGLTGTVPTWNQNTTGNAATATNVAWTGVTAGRRTNYDLGFEAPASGYAGFSFTTPGGAAENAGYFLIRGGADNGVYTQNGITLVADAGWLTLAQRTTAGKGVRIMTGTTPTERLTVLEGGSIGVGTSSPTSLLHVYNNADVWHTRIGGASGELRIGGQTSSGAVIQAYTPAGSVRDLYIQRDGGSVGIGTTSPTATLQINGAGGDGSPTLRLLSTTSDTFNWSIDARYANLATGETAIHLIGKANSQYNQAYFGYRHVSDGSTSNMVTIGMYASDYLVNIIGNGNVGIGTTSPDGRLDVQASNTGVHLARVWNTNTAGTGASVLRIANSGNNNNGNRIEFTDQQYYTATISGDRTQGIVFRTSATGGDPIAIDERMRITPAGLVGIGVTTPINGSRFEVRGSGVWDGGVITLTNSGTGGRSWSIFSTNNSFSQGGGSLLIYNTTAGTNPMVIDSSDRVGIGLTNPSYKLHVAGTSWFEAEQSISYTNSIQSMYGGSGYSLFRMYGASNAVEMQIDSHSHNANAATIGTYSNHDVFIKTNQTNKMVIKAGGNVGIGTTTPSQKLHVNGSAYLESGNLFLTQGNYITWNSGDNFIKGISGYHLQFTTYDGSAAQVEVLRLTGGTAASGGARAGIGVSVPQAKLHVSGTADVFLAKGSGSATNTTIMAVDGNNGRLFEVSDDLSDSLFSVNTIAGLPVIEAFADYTVTMGSYNKSDLVVTGSKVGIGTPNPQRKLDVYDSGSQIVAQFSSSNASSVRIKFTDANTGAENVNIGAIGTRMAMWTNNTERVSILSGGNVGVNTTSPAAQLEVYKASDAFISVKTGGGSVAYLQLTTPSSDTGYLIKNTTTGNGALDKSLYLYNGTGPIQFVPNGTIGNAVTIDTSGNIGIGSTSPAFKLDVNGGIRTITGYIQGANSSADITIDGTTGTLLRYGTQKILLNSTNAIHYTNDTIRVFITNGGNVGIGTTTAPAAKLHVQGTLRVDNAGGPPVTNNGAAPDSYHGGSGVWLGRPDEWLAVNVSGVAYVIPLYIPE